MAPTLVSTTPTAWNLTGTSKTLSLTCSAGDCLVLMATSGDAGTTVSSVSGPAGVTWTARTSQAGTANSNAPIKTWSMDNAPAVTAGTVTLTYGNTNNVTAAVLWVYRNGVYGTSASTANTTNATPSQAITTTGANSALAMLSVDWNALDNSAATYNTSAGAYTPATPGIYRDTTNWATYWGAYGDVGAAGAKTVGIATPTGQRPTIAVIEVVAAGGAAPASAIRRGGKWAW